VASGSGEGSWDDAAGGAAAVMHPDEAMAAAVDAAAVR